MSHKQLEDLKSAHRMILAQYKEYMEDVRAMQRVVNDAVLPDVLEELGLGLNTVELEEANRAAREWLADEGA